MAGEITSEELFEAFNHALARIREWDGAGIEAKVQAFGLDVDAVRELLEERWAQHAPNVTGAEPHVLFVQGFAEGLITGLQLGRRP